MRRVEILALFEKITVWKKKGQRAPHKPLLALLALADIQLGRERLRPYADIDKPLRKLLQEFGPARQSYHPEYPFWHLQSDGLWEVGSDEPMRPRTGNTDPPKRELLRTHAQGGFTAEVHAALRRNRTLQVDVVQQLLDAHFDGPKQGGNHPTDINRINRRMLLAPSSSLTFVGSRGYGKRGADDAVLT
ncbi:hypothetical protein KKG45_08085 [bacterium]|nr:hypothetical protein [bacterium]MBU1073192.1 hypothetical protein [bacterium]